MKVTYKDVSIVAYLRMNARERLTKLARKTGIPVSTIFDRLRLHEGGFIQKHTTLVDFQYLGFLSRANIILKVEKTQREEIKEFLKQSRQINSAYRINNGYDFFVEVIGRNMKELEDFREQLEEKFGIKEQSIFYVVDDIKKEEFLSTPEAINFFFPEKVLQKRNKS